jgi:hypothetical protein
MSPLPNQRLPNQGGVPEEFAVSAVAAQHRELPVQSQSGLAMLLMSSPWAAKGSAPSRAIADRDLLFYIRGRLLRRLTIVQTDLGSYRLRVSLKWDHHEYVLSGAAGRPLEWSSLDSVAKQIRCRYGSSASVALSLAEAAGQEPLEVSDVLDVARRRESEVNLQCDCLGHRSSADPEAHRSGPAL